MFGFLLSARLLPEGQGVQTERLLRWILLAIVIGFVAIVVGALCGYRRDGIWGVLCFISVGSLAALMAMVVGGALGLLFGLPVGSKVVIVTPAADGKTAPAGNDWFGDNNAMEQIVDWLTKIIVGLGLTQAAAIAAQFDRIAAATSIAMGARNAGSADAGKVVGGAILVTYLVLGFVGLFVWARRYLKQEWTEERKKRLEAQERAFLERSAAADTRQQPRGDIDATIAINATALAQSQKAAGGTFPTPIEPGSRPDDPWAGQFGGKPSNGVAALQATVRTLQSNDDLFGVDLTVRGIDETSRRQLAGKQARLYLHPTFNNHIRLLTFDAAGEIKLPLVCYGSFTVGVQLDGGEVLELDLAKLEGVPAKFRDR